MSGEGVAGSVDFERSLSVSPLAASVRRPKSHTMPRPGFLENAFHERPFPTSSQEILDDLPMHVGQAEVAAGMVEGELLVVEAE